MPYNNRNLISQLTVTYANVNDPSTYRLISHHNRQIKTLKTSYSHKTINTKFSFHLGELRSMFCPLHIKRLKDNQSKKNIDQNQKYKF